MQRRIDERAAFLHEEAGKLEEQFERFVEGARHVQAQIAALQTQLLEAERAELGGEAFDAVEREVNVLLSDVELVRAQGSELCSKSEQYCHTVEVSEFEFFFHSLFLFFYLLVTFCEVSLSVILT